jgi:NTP pyrophosphatase (non-canonical NTP hydrolase)
MNELDEITQRLRKFAKDRDWDQFHSPKNLTMALSVEVAELVEHFQWLTEDQSKALDAKTLAEVTDEIADVQAYLIRLADKLNVDIVKAVEAKIVKNEAKYPADKVKGSAKKYTKYKDDESQ